MKIGSMTVDSIVDGEMLAPPEFIYPDVSSERIEKYSEFLDPLTGSFVISAGSFLVRYDDRVVLFDLGIGPKPIYPFVGGALRGALIALGVEPADVTDIVFTHLHFDHFGWVSHDGKPVFPNATIHCDLRDWEEFVTEDREIPDWEAGASTPETDAAPVKFAPVQDSVKTWNGGGHEILPNITTIDAPGHTPGTVVFELASEGERGFIIGDLVHTIPELLDTWEFLVAHDQQMAEKSLREIRNLIVEDDIPCVGSHFTGMRWGRVRRGSDGYQWCDIEDQ